MNKYMTQLATLGWSKIFGIGVALAVGYYFLMYDNGSTIEASIKAAQDRTTAAKKTLAETEKAMADADRFGKEVQATQDQFEKIIRFMPMSLDSNEMTKTINDITNEVGVRARIEPKPVDPPNGFTQSVKIDLQLEGNFSQIVTFLSKISQVQRLLVFDKITLAPNATGGVTTSQGAALTFKATLIGYRYLKDAPDPLDNAPPGAPGQPPAQPATPPAQPGGAS